MASLLVSETIENETKAERQAGDGVDGLICLGFPFFAPGKERIEDNNRGVHLAAIQLPTLVVQGERDTFGTAADLDDLPFSASVSRVILPDGDHSFVPRKKSGYTLEQNMQLMADAIDDFIKNTVV